MKQGHLPQSFNWGSSGQIMIVNRKKPNHLSHSIILPVLPDFLLLFVLTVDDKSSCHSLFTGKQIPAAIWIKTPGAVDQLGSNSSFFSVLVAFQVDCNKWSHFWMNVNSAFPSTSFWSQMSDHLGSLLWKYEGPRAFFSLHQLRTYRFFPKFLQLQSITLEPHGG